MNKIFTTRDFNIEVCDETYDENGVEFWLVRITKFKSGALKEIGHKNFYIRPTTDLGSYFYNPLLVRELYDNYDEYSKIKITVRSIFDITTY